MLKTSKPYLSVIIPAYNEVKRLPLTLIDIDKHLSRVNFSYEIVVVDDGSIDGTHQLVNKFKKLIPNLKLIRYENNQGKGNAVKVGMTQSEGRYRIFTDADNSTSIDQFEKMIPHLKAGADIVIGSRDIKGAEMVPPQSLFKRILGNMGNLFIQILVLPGIWDTQCGFKCFSDKAAMEIFPKQKITGWGFDIEALSLAKRLGYKTKEIPVLWVNDTQSKVGASAYIKVLLETVKIRIWLWRGAYGIKS